jgi:hypothetical protein
MKKDLERSIGCLRAEIEASALAFERDTGLEVDSAECEYSWMPGAHKHQRACNVGLKFKA